MGTATVVELGRLEVTGGVVIPDGWARVVVAETRADDVGVDAEVLVTSGAVVVGFDSAVAAAAVKGWLRGVVTSGAICQVGVGGIATVGTGIVV